MTEEETDIAKVNELVANGYRLVKVDLRPVYILESEEKPQPKKQEAKLSWGSISWHFKEEKKNFAWTYVSDVEGRVYPEIQPFLDFLKKSGSPIKEGNFEYSISKNGKFLNRIKHSGE